LFLGALAHSTCRNALRHDRGRAVNTGLVPLLDLAQDCVRGFVMAATGVLLTRPDGVGEEPAAKIRLADELGELLLVDGSRRRGAKETLVARRLEDLLDGRIPPSPILSFPGIFHIIEPMPVSFLNRVG